MKKSDQDDIASWFHKKADPRHATIIINGNRWDYKDEKWSYKLVEKKFQDYWDRINELVVSKNPRKLTSSASPKKSESINDKPKRAAKSKGVT